MNLPLNEILAVVRGSNELTTGFDALREIGRSRLPSKAWNNIRTPETEADVLLATAWLKESIFYYQPTGVYLGLDTLNENDGQGKNIEIGMTRAADPKKLEMTWVYTLPERGEDHLIEGMYRTHRAYQKLGLAHPGTLADYLFFLGYSGLVLVSALERINVNWECVFVWGFHDGDMGYLARSSPRGVERLAIIGDVA